MKQIPASLLTQLAGMAIALISLWVGQHHGLLPEQVNDAAALQIAIQVIEQIEQLEKLPDDWDELTPILSSRKEEPNIRLYLNAYAASGLVRARMGAIDDAKTIASRVNEIDSKREFGAATVLDILTNSDGEEED